MEIQNRRVVDLFWSGPFRFADFIRSPRDFELFRSAGVYLWVEEQTDQARLSYIGKVTGKPSLLQRQQDHYSNIIGARWNIPAEYRDKLREWIPNQYPGNAEILLDAVNLVKSKANLLPEIRLVQLPS